MSNERIRTYEGMFLFPQSATANLQAAVDHVKEILDRCGATIVSFRKWDDRRLAYEIDGNKRGVYFLAYFTAPTTTLAEIERRCNLSEELLRTMVTSAEHIPDEIIDANEGQADLAAEIKLRGEESGDKDSKSGSSLSQKREETQIDVPDDEPDAAPQALPETESSETAAQEGTQEDNKDTSEATKEVQTEA